MCIHCPLWQIRQARSTLQAIIPRKGKAPKAAPVAAAAPEECPSTPTAADAEAGERAGPPQISPGKLDTLLPGYLSRPNASPMASWRARPAALSASEPQGIARGQARMPDSPDVSLPTGVHEVGSKPCPGTASLEVELTPAIGASALAGYFTAEGFPKDAEAAAAISLAALPADALRLFNAGCILARIVSFLDAAHIQVSVFLVEGRYLF